MTTAVANTQGDQLLPAAIHRVSLSCRRRRSLYDQATVVTLGVASRAGPFGEPWGVALLADVVFLLLPTVGLIIAVRRPEVVFGWLLLATAFAFGAGELGHSYATQDRRAALLDGASGASSARPSRRSGALAAGSATRVGDSLQRRPAGVVGRSRLGSATRVDAVSDHCAGVLGWMFLLLWNTFSGSYLAFTSASRR